MGATLQIFFQSIGIISFLIPITLFFTGINILETKILSWWLKYFLVTLYSIFGSLFFSFYYENSFSIYIKE